MIITIALCPYVQRQSNWNMVLSGVNWVTVRVLETLTWSVITSYSINMKYNMGIKELEGIVISQAEQVWMDHLIARKSRHCKKCDEMGMHMEMNDLMWLNVQRHLTSKHGYWVKSNEN